MWGHKMSIKRVMCILGLLFVAGPNAWSGEKDRNQTSERQHEMLQERGRSSERYENQNRLHERERIYGWQLMSPAERLAHRQHMQSLKTLKERQAYRKQHHERMKKRAEEMGVELQERVQQ